ncbi:MAG: extracellular factor (EF) 3-hydroxypalmitic acid methyl ester biosynthesis protein [Candidatus Pelagisphaera sp.]|jgi:extracellular factor (EF) 3-hydroxypalmitic acid methyl ester biosynthesis protein
MDTIEPSNLSQSKLSGIDSLVSFKNSQGKDCRGTLIHITRNTAVFEVYNPYSIVQLSEVLPHLNILRGSRMVYQGKAVVSHMLSTGLMVIVSTTLVDAWSDLNELLPGKELKAETHRFVEDWAISHRIQPNYQLTVGTLRNFLSELSRWLDEAEAGAFGTSNSIADDELRREFVDDVRGPIEPKFGELVVAFENAASEVPDEFLMSHKAYVQRELHPLLLCSPFVHRSYTKPLGYAGDYEMVNMMLCESTTKVPGIYANIVDEFHIKSAAPKAHRNRVVMLQERLEAEAARVVEEERMFTVLNIGCGPAVEAQRFIRDSPLANQTSLQLMDFSDETLDYTKQKISASIEESGRKPVTKFVHKSIDTLLKEIHENDNMQIGKFDMVYCAGLFDYFSDAICKRLVALFHEALNSGGLVCVTNVHSNNPNRFLMEHLLDWYLVYRNEDDMKKLAPRGTNYEIECDDTGVNIFLDIRLED